MSFNPGIKMKIWLDDIRPCPDDSWRRAFTAWDAIELLKNNKVSEISLDHDLGDSHNGSGYCDPGPGTGYDVCLWMAEHQKFPPVVRVHSMNPVGKANMLAVIKRYKND